MILKKHYNQGRLVLAMCDNNLLGKKYEEGKLILDLTSSFYKGEKTSEDVVLELLKKAYLINAVGEKTISFLIDNKLLSNSGVKKIKDIPYAHVVFEGKKD